MIDRATQFLFERLSGLRQVISRKRCEFFAGTIAVWVVYIVVVEAVAHAVLRDAGQTPNPDARFYLHGFIDNLSDAPPLARWDSIWYYGIAREGYTGSGAESAYTPAFLPLYPLFMRFLSYVTGLDELSAGLWVSRLALLVTLLLLPHCAVDRQPSVEQVWSAQFALLAFPSAFILVSAYAESLFLVFALASFVFARHNQPLAAASVGFLAGLTRPHGLALVPALALFSLQRWRSGVRSPWAALPALGPATAYAGLVAYYWMKFGDPLRYLSAKRELWHTRLAAPWTTIWHAVMQAEGAAARGDLGAFFTFCEIPCFYLIVFTMLVLWTRREWPELAYVACGTGLSLVSGTLWGLPRFVLVMFPVFILVGALDRRPRWWALYLLVGGVLQTCLLINYVNFRWPPP